MECVSYEENTCRAIQLRKEKVFADAQLWLNNGELRTHRLGMRFVLDSATCKTIQLEELKVLASLHIFGSVDLIALECASYKETTRSLLPKFWQKYGAGCGWVLKRINVHREVTNYWSKYNAFAAYSGNLADRSFLNWWNDQCSIFNDRWKLNIEHLAKCRHNSSL